MTFSSVSGIAMAFLAPLELAFLLCIVCAYRRSNPRASSLSAPPPKTLATYSACSVLKVSRIGALQRGGHRRVQVKSDFVAGFEGSRLLRRAATTGANAAQRPETLRIALASSPDDHARRVASPDDGARVAAQERIWVVKRATEQLYAGIEAKDGQPTPFVERV